MSPPPLPVPLSVDPALHDDLVTATLSLTAGGQPLSLALTIPAGPATTEDLLPVLQGMSSLFAARGEARVAAAGKPVSCRAGCGACCRQCVPVAAAEARRLAALVAAMPEPRRSQVRARFDAAVTALAAAGLLDRLERGGAIDTNSTGMAYFRLGIACPFLEDEACSIHPDRPLACREYLVTSPARSCASPDPATIEMVPIEWEVSTSLLEAERAEGWTPLVLALRHAERAPAGAAARTGPDILNAVVATRRR